MCKKINYISSLSVLVLLASCLYAEESKILFPSEITSVVVRDENFEVVSELNQSQIQYLSQIGPSLVAVEKIPENGWPYKLDIKANKYGGRWLYCEQGYLAKLNYSMKPLFKINNKKEFEIIIFSSQNNE